EEGLEPGFARVPDGAGPRDRRAPEGTVREAVMRVAFCGMGRMGRAMAANLVAAGHDVRAWNRTAGKAPPGAREFSSVREAAAGAEVAITSLADDGAVETVSRELLEALAAGAVHCGMSTISVKLSRSLAERHR